MLRVSCRYLDLSELPSTFDASRYKTMIRPLNYDFSLVRNAVYLVIAVRVRRGTLWLYVMPDWGDKEIQIVPAALFSFSDGSIPSGMHMTLQFEPEESLEILPESLAKIERWFEQYIDGDERIVKIIESLRTGS